MVRLVTGCRLRLNERIVVGAQLWSELSWRWRAHSGERAVAEWEYRKINLNDHGQRGNELDMLNAAGADGWQLVGITSNNIAYLKRSLEGEAPKRAEDHDGATQDPDANDREETGGRVHEVRVKYRDPATNETWSGRGRMANWLKRKQDAGEDIAKYLV